MSVQPKFMNVCQSHPSWRRLSVVWMATLGWLGTSFLGHTILLAEPVQSPVASPISEPPASKPAPTEATALPDLPSTPVSVPEGQPSPIAAPSPPSQTPASPTAASARQPANPVPTGGYIDPTDYSLGATPYTPPTDLVFSERSTGCQVILRDGQTINGTCPPGSRAAGDRTSAAAEAASAGDEPAVQLGPVSITPLGISTTAFSVNAADYYNLTPRPTPQVGNNNLRLLFPLWVPAPITSIFGWRLHPIAGVWRLHTGTDLGAPMGTPVVAAFAGYVAISDFLGGYGLTVVLNHYPAGKQPPNADGNHNRETLYAHLSEIYVKPGEWVEQGDVIGRVGSTGYSTGPHLHFEVREQTSAGWVAIDPGQQLEIAIVELMEGLNIAQARPHDSDHFKMGLGQTIASQSLGQLPMLQRQSGLGSEPAQPSHRLIQPAQIQPSQVVIPGF